MDGFRIDVAHGMAKAAGHAGHGPAGAQRTRCPSRSGDQDPRFDVDGVHDVHRLIRRVLDSYPDRMAVGEVWVHTDDGGWPATSGRTS